MFVREPGENSRQRLGPIVIVERGQRVPLRGLVEPDPAGSAAGQLHHARHEHQFEKQKLKEKQRDRRSCCSRDRRSRIFLGPKLPGREKNREKPGFEQKDVPLETKKVLPRHGEREIKNEKQRCRNRRRDEKNEENGKDDAAAAKKMEKGIARTDPTQCWQDRYCHEPNLGFGVS